MEAQGKSQGAAGGELTRLARIWKQRASALLPPGWVGGYKIETASKPNASDAIDMGNVCHKQPQSASCRNQHAT